MKRNDPAGPGRGIDGTRNRTDNRIVPLNRPRPKRPGITFYREQRSPAEFARTIRDALEREARLARLTGMNITPEVLEQISAWVGRGCLP